MKKRKVYTLLLLLLLFISILGFKINSNKNTFATIYNNQADEISDSEIYNDENTNFLLIEDIEFYNNFKNTFVYFGRPTCPTCIEINPIIEKIIKSEYIDIYFFNTDYWRENKHFNNIIEKYNISNVPCLIYIKNNESYSQLDFFNGNIDLDNNEDIKNSIIEFIREWKNYG